MFHLREKSYLVSKEVDVKMNEGGEEEERDTKRIRE